jgi:hypothetical protein
VSQTGSYLIKTTMVWKIVVLNIVNIANDKHVQNVDTLQDTHATTNRKCG